MEKAYRHCRRAVERMGESVKWEKSNQLEKKRVASQRETSPEILLF